MSDWFVKGPEEQIGPLRPADLLRLVRSGEVTPETLIRKGDSSWFEASAVGGLFEAAMRPTIEHFCPSCGRPVREPPCTCNECGREIHQARMRITENTILNSQNAHDGTPPGRSVQKWLKKVRGKKQ